MFEQDLTCKILIGILSFCDSIEKVLVLINDKINLISSCCSNEKSTIVMSSLEKCQKNDNIEKVIEEIEKIIKYEKDNSIFFISFDVDFWNYYIHLIDDIKKLFSFKKSVILCSSIDKELSTEKLNLSNKIHKIGFDSVRNGFLINEELLEFINIDEYFHDDKSVNKYYRPLDIVKGIDFDKMNENFFIKWNNSNIFKIYSFADNEFKSRIIEQISDIKNFGKLLKLFDYKNKTIFDSNLVQKLREKFKNLMITYELKKCPMFVEDIANYIYIIDFQRVYDMIRFLNSTIEKFIQSIETIVNIYIHLINNYKDISNKVNEHIVDFLCKNKKQLNTESILFLLENINSINDIESILNNIENFTIKEEELFNQEKNLDSFQLLDKLEQIGFFKKKEFEQLSKTKYFIIASQNKENILKKIKNYEIKYNLLCTIHSSKENKNLFHEKLRIILLNNKEDIAESINRLNEKFSYISQQIESLENLIQKLKQSFDIYYIINFSKIEKLIISIKSGMMNEIDKPEIKNDIDDIYKTYTEKFNKYKNSKFFVRLYKMRKYNNNNIAQKESEILKLTENDFQKLKLLFKEENWYKEIPEEIMKECFRSLKNKKRSRLYDELLVLINIFEIKEFDDLKMNSLKYGFLTFCQKEEIILTAKNCLFFVDELEVIKTDFYKDLQERINNLENNLDFNMLKNLVNILENVGINIIDPNEEDIDYLNILKCNYTKDSIKFIANFDDYDIKRLQELIAGEDAKLINKDILQDVIKCNNFIYNLGELKAKISDDKLIQYIIKETEKSKGIANHL